MSRVLIAVLGLIAVVNCGSKSNPAAPVAPPAPLCQTRNTAALRFENRSVLNRTYDVFIDNSLATTITPGQTSGEHTVVAGVRHPVDFFYTNTRIRACLVDPVPIQCTTQTYFCTF